MLQMKPLYRQLLALSLALVLTLGIALPALGEATPPKVVFQADGQLLPPQDSGLSLYVLPLLGADCMLLHDHGQWMLVDMGRRKDYPHIKELLERLGVDKIDIAFNTHPHSDHIGGMVPLIEDYPVDRFVTVFRKNLTGPSILQISTIKALDRAKIPVERMNSGDSFTLGQARIELFKTSHQNVNGASAVLRVSYGDTSLLLAADINRVAQDRLAHDHGSALAADVLKYPHHGQEKLDDDFTEAVSPAFALITNGSIKSADGQKWLGRHGIPFAFATWGVISLYADGQTIQISQELTEEGRGYRERFRPQ